MFVEVAPENAEDVTEEVFVKMFQVVRKEQEVITLGVQIKKECEERFRKQATHRTSLTVLMAARVLSNMLVELHERGVLPAERTMKRDEVLKELKKYDTDKDNRIDLNEFLTAVEHLCLPRSDPCP